MRRIRGSFHEFRTHADGPWTGDGLDGPRAASPMPFGNSAATNGGCKRLRSALTPSHSSGEPGEREERSRPSRECEPRFESDVRRIPSRLLTCSQNGIDAANAPACHHAAAAVPPLPGGEGWGEGKSSSTSRSYSLREEQEQEPGRFMESHSFLFDLPTGQEPAIARTDRGLSARSGAGRRRCPRVRSCVADSIRCGPQARAPEERFMESGPG